MQNKAELTKIFGVEPFEKFKLAKSKHWYYVGQDNKLHKITENGYEVVNDEVIEMLNNPHKLLKHITFTTEEQYALKHILNAFGFTKEAYLKRTVGGNLVMHDAGTEKQLPKELFPSLKLGKAVDVGAVLLL